MKKETQNNIMVCSAVGMLIVGVSLNIAGVIVPPTGEISDSVLWDKGMVRPSLCHGHNKLRPLRSPGHPSTHPNRARWERRGAHGSLHVFITKLRHHLRRDPSIRIINVRGIGYKIVCGSI